MGLYDFSWEAFRATGDIEAYLLIKNLENTGKKEEQEEWQASKPTD